MPARKPAQKINRAQGARNAAANAARSNNRGSGYTASVKRRSSKKGSESEEESSEDEQAVDPNKEQRMSAKAGPSGDNRPSRGPASRKGLLDDSDDGSDDEDEDEDEDEEMGGAPFGGSSDGEESSGDELDLERQARLLDEEEEQEAEEAREEQLRAQGDNETYDLAAATRLGGGGGGGDDSDGEHGGVGSEEPQVVRKRIGDVVDVLLDFNARRKAGVARSDYVAQLERDLHDYFGYLPELVEHFLQLFSPRECLEFFEANEQPRPTVIRTNTLKTRREDLMATLTERGMALEPLAPWSKEGIKIARSQVPIGATPEYLAGHYMLQAASSMCSVMALRPQQKERILDMASAPGGKTSHIAQMMRNTGVLVANDIKKSRLKSTAANLARLGVQNCLICNYDGRRFPAVMGGFDRVLLDAPCTGFGVIARDPSIKVQKTVKDVLRMAHLQKELLLAAIDSADANSKTGGVIVYSTCSVCVEENEEVVQYALERRNVRIVATGLEHATPGFTRFGKRRFHPNMNLTSRFYPHVHNMDGFYVTKFVKFSNAPKAFKGDALDKAEAKAAAKKQGGAAPKKGGREEERSEDEDMDMDDDGEQEEEDGDGEGGEAAVAEITVPAINKSYKVPTKVLKWRQQQMLEKAQAKAQRVAAAAADQKASAAEAAAAASGGAEDGKKTKKTRKRANSLLEQAEAEAVAEAPPAAKKEKKKQPKKKKAKPPAEEEEEEVEVAAPKAKKKKAKKVEPPAEEEEAAAPKAKKKKAKKVEPPAEEEEAAAPKAKKKKEKKEPKKKAKK